MQLHVQEPYASLLKGDLISFSLFHCTIRCMYLVSPSILNPKLKPSVSIMVTDGSKTVEGRCATDGYRR